MVDFTIYGHRIKGADNLGNTPAKVFRNKKLILLNNQTFFDLPLYAQKIIILHELGHSIHETSDEFKADEFAFKNYVGSEPRSLKKSIKTLADVLPMKTDEQKQRFREIIRKAAVWDVKQGNKNAINILNKMNRQHNIGNSYIGRSGTDPMGRGYHTVIRPSKNAEIQNNHLDINTIKQKQNIVVLHRELLKDLVSKAKRSRDLSGELEDTKELLTQHNHPVSKSTTGPEKSIKIDDSQFQINKNTIIFFLTIWFLLSFMIFILKAKPTNNS